MIEARKVQALIKGKRSTDTRRKILAGALVLDMMERDEDTKKRFNNLLNKFITRPDDRALFDLPPLPLPVAEKQRQLPQ